MSNDDPWRNIKFYSTRIILLSLLNQQVGLVTSLRIILRLVEFYIRTTQRAASLLVYYYFNTFTTTRKQVSSLEKYFVIINSSFGDSLSRSFQGISLTRATFPSEGRIEKAGWLPKRVGANPKIGRWKAPNRRNRAESPT